MGVRRESNKREMRQRISDVATELFFARGYEAVTLDEIAAAAGVSKMTIFNYFSRKEELVLDREDDLLLRPLRDALRDRPKGESPIAALRTLIARLNEEGRPLARIDELTVNWWRVVAASVSLRARLHELADQAAAELAVELGKLKPDGLARLAAGMIVLTVSTARAEAVRVFEAGGSAKKVNATFLALVERGFLAVDQMWQASQSGAR